MAIPKDFLDEAISQKTFLNLPVFPEMMELFINNGNLIGKDEWEKKIEAIETGFNSLETNKERAKRRLMDAIQLALLSRTKDLGRFGILFSGGLDSALLAFLCKKNGLNFTCYTIGIENSQDIEYAKEIAERYGLDLKHKILPLEEFENAIKDTIKILGSCEIVWVSVGSVLYAAARLALQDNIKVLFAGLGTEEIFAGYQRHEEALKCNDFEALHRECWSGLRNMWQRDLLRDFRIARHLGIELRTPYMDENLIKIAMSVHPMHKLGKGQKKIILREAAEDFGLDREFAGRKKKAAQYGSNFIKGMDKLARKSGFSTKKEYLQSLANKLK